MNVSVELEVEVQLEFGWPQVGETRSRPDREDTVSALLAGFYGVPLALDQGRLAELRDACAAYLVRVLA